MSTTQTYLGRGSLIALFLIVCLALSPAAFAQNSPGPQPASLPPPIVTPADRPYLGTISLFVDLTDMADRVVKVHETIPVEGREVTLLYPEWIPGEHSPMGPISRLAGLVITAQGQRVAWVRDPVNLYAFHISVPQGAKTLDLSFQYLSPGRPGDDNMFLSPNIVDLSWNEALLYPAGYFSRRIEFAPAVRLPEGWNFATALETASQDGGLIHFRETPLNTLVDSPVMSGRYSERSDLSLDSANRVFLDAFADSSDQAHVTPQELREYRNLVREAQNLFGSRHYEHYDFLLALTDAAENVGLEHHESSENGAGPDYFANWGAGVDERDTLPHEYVHSWNGKYRRPDGLWTPNFNVPMRNDLLWVYEGLTQYYGFVLTARSGLLKAEDSRDILARYAAELEATPGRAWRPLLDTTYQPILSEDSPLDWPSWQRDADYYTEGLLIWLEVDTTIRKLSGEKKSLDDFAKLFFGGDNGSFVTKTYELEDLVAALQTVQPYDWASFFRARVYDLAPQPPENGILQGGYQLVYNDIESDWMKEEKADFGAANFITSLGFNVFPSGRVGLVRWDSPAFKAGVTAGMQIGSVNDELFSVADLRDAVIAAEKSEEPIKLALSRGGPLLTLSIDYHGGLRYPHLEMANESADRLDAILAPTQ